LATAPFSDGTPQAAQWPIPPLHYFDYELHVPKGMAGTYFYHSHVGFQAISVTGPLIVGRYFFQDISKHLLDSTTSDR
jgi:L-ascorbate oxidase